MTERALSLRRGRVAVFPQFSNSTKCSHYGAHFEAPDLQNPNSMSISSLFLYCLCLGGLRHVTIETDLVKLWVSEGGRLNEEMGYLGQVKFERESGHLVHKVKRAVEQTTKPPAPAVKAEVRRGPELPKENGLGGGFQVGTPRRYLDNKLKKKLKIFRW